MLLNKKKCENGEENNFFLFFFFFFRLFVNFYDFEKLKCFF